MAHASVQLFGFLRSLLVALVLCAVVAACGAQPQVAQEENPEAAGEQYPDSAGAAEPVGAESPNEEDAGASAPTEGGEVEAKPTPGGGDSPPPGEGEAEPTPRDSAPEPSSGGSVPPPAPPPPSPPPPSPPPPAPPLPRPVRESPTTSSAPSRSPAASESSQASAAAEAARRQQQAEAQRARSIRESSSPVLPPFPWPPPEPSARELIPRRDLLRTDAAVSQGEIGRRIQNALRQAGYTEYSYYSAPGGFALVARLERMKPDGTPDPGEFRFLAPNADEPFSLSSYVSRLFFAPEGYYRQIVFVTTDKPFVASAPAPTAAEAQRLLRQGGNQLPIEYDSRPFSAAHSVTALIYEFKKNPADRDVETLQPGRIAGAQHLSKAGIRFGGAP